MLAEADEACARGDILRARSLLDSARTAYEMDGAQGMKLVLQGMEERITWVEEEVARERQVQSLALQEKMLRSKERILSRPPISVPLQPKALLSSEFVRESFQPGWPFVAGYTSSEFVAGDTSSSEDAALRRLPASRSGGGVDGRGGARGQGGRGGGVDAGTD